MKNTYQINGITCKGCQLKVEKVMKEVAGVKQVSVSENWKQIEIESEHPIMTGTLQHALSKYPKYKIMDSHAQHLHHHESFWDKKNIWKKAIANTFNCLIGCTIGDFAMMTYLQANYHHINMFLMVVLAMASGITTSIMLETLILKIREGFDWKHAFNTAIGMSLMSMVVMELAENITDLLITGGQMSISDPNYWLAMLPAIAAGFLVPLPYNYYKLIKYGKACH